jgi:8-oxo-dGTP diphosphatase
MEETGAVEFSLDCVATYSVEKDGNTGYGRLFLAEVNKMGTLPGNSEISEVIFVDNLPENLTYQDIQPHLFRKVIEFLKGEERN